MVDDLTNQEKLEEIYKLTVENHDILTGMRGREKLANALRVFYWIVVIGAIGGVYLYIRPALDLITSNKNKIEGTLQRFEQLRDSFPETRAINNLVNSFKATSTETSTTTNTQP